MPGTSLGPNADWKNVSKIEELFYEKIRRELQKRTQRKVTLDIEKKKVSQGVIFKSMFAEAVDADVYIADLTGANANVYLELGVRWALADNVTVLVSQSSEDVLFNAAASRYIPYSEKFEELERAIGQVCDAVTTGLRTEKIDSPVRDGLALVTLRRAELENLKRQRDALTADRVKDLLEAALHSNSGDVRKELLERALAIDDVSFDANYMLGVTLRKIGDLAGSIARLENAITIRPDSDDAWRELGVSQSKSEIIEEAINSLKRAIELNSNDSEAWSNLGGAYRRKALAVDPLDRSALEESRDSYKRASMLSRYALYPLMNIARVQLLIDAAAGRDSGEATRLFTNALHLCNHEVQQSREELERQENLKSRQALTWFAFDLAEASLLSGAEGWEEGYQYALSLLTTDSAAEYISSVLPPLESYLQYRVVAENQLEKIRLIVETLRTRVS
ncbi:tetratricopeptide repeat protein [Frankia gtarii]|uniref:tetratricopeptide repeat protein n=1 Tax=Frankia gtarii TaxID=2950102 RepID=UPI0021C04195|nr:tetratricopeptide repeat protein [Frankia gtarii]